MLSRPCSFGSTSPIGPAVRAPAAAELLRRLPDLEGRLLGDAAALVDEPPLDSSRALSSASAAALRIAARSGPGVAAHAGCASAASFEALHHVVPGGAADRGQMFVSGGVVHVEPLAGLPPATAEDLAVEDLLGDQAPGTDLVCVATSIAFSSLVLLGAPGSACVSCLTAILYATGEERTLVDASELAL